MPSPKSGNAGSLVPPAAPASPTDALNADPGENTTVDPTTNSKSGSQDHTPFKKPTGDDKKTKKSWIEIVLLGEDKNPIPGEKYRITLPDDSVAEGTLDEKGFARVEGFDPGTCKITFPDLDQDAWKPA